MNASDNASTGSYFTSAKKITQSILRFMDNLVDFNTIRQSNQQLTNDLNNDYDLIKTCEYTLKHDLYRNKNKLKLNGGSSKESSSLCFFNEFY